MQSRQRICTLLWAGRTHVWGAEKGWGRMGRSEQSSFRKPGQVRHLIPGSFPCLSSIGTSFFPGCGSAPAIDTRSQATCHGKRVCFQPGPHGSSGCVGPWAENCPKWLSICGPELGQRSQGQRDSMKLGLCLFSLPLSLSRQTLLITMCQAWL